MIRFKLFIFPRKTRSVFFKNAFHIKSCFFYLFFSSQMQKVKWKSTFFLETHGTLFYNDLALVGKNA